MSVNSGCRHCGSPCTSPFCCTGCEAVYTLLHAARLDRYYDLNSPDGRPPSSNAMSFAYVDAPQSVFVDPQTPDQIKAFLEGIHCTACLWLMDNLPKLSPTLVSAHLDMSTSTVTLRRHPGTAFAPCLDMLYRLGYTPHPLAANASSDALVRKENRSLLTQIGIAGAIAGNIMLMTVAVYGGASGAYRTFFGWTSALLMIPLLTYCAGPFYHNCRLALAHRHMSIDIPIVSALWLGTLISTWNLINHSPEWYFDSLAMLTFLLLSSRYFLRRVQQHYLKQATLIDFLGSQTLHRVTSHGIEEVHRSQLCVGDRLRVYPGEMVPTDGEVIEGKSGVNAAVLTGESEPQPVGPHQSVFLGTTNMDATLDITVTAVGDQTRMGQLFQRANWVTRPRLSMLTDRIATLLVVAVGVLIALIWIALWRQPEVAMHRTLALLIMTCPCALGLATPLCFSLATQLALKKGIIVKTADTFEILSRAQPLYMDKTGTLTYGMPHVVHVQGDLDAGQLSAIYAIETQSKHPLAGGICRYLKPYEQPDLRVAAFKEYPGGISGEVNGHRVTLRTLDTPHRLRQFERATQVEIRFDDREAGIIVLADTVRAEAPEVMAYLRNTFDVTLLSGDHRAVCKSIADTVGIPAQAVESNLTPDDKLARIQAVPGVMVGDGANDAAALKAATVGIAMQGSFEGSFQSADVYLSVPGLAPLRDLCMISKKMMTTLYLNLTVSGLYNLVGAGLAVIGMMNPLLAAILMPVSSISVVLLTVMRQKK